MKDVETCVKEKNRSQQKSRVLFEEKSGGRVDDQARRRERKVLFV